jgi:hypothetical protein
MAHNVPAVYDVLAARIRALRSKDQGRQNVGGVERGRRSRPSETEPRAAYWRRSVNSPVRRRCRLYLSKNTSRIISVKPNIPNPPITVGAV